MNKELQDFDAQEMSNKPIQETRQVTRFNGSMAVCLDNGVVLITKQQAMDFFGLVDTDSELI